MHIQDSETPNYKGKRILILGLGKSGMAAAKYLHNKEANVRVVDMKPRDHLLNFVEDLEKLQPAIEFEFGNTSPEVLNNIDLMVVSPGVSAEGPLMQEVRARGIPQISEIDLALRDIKTPVVAITGSYGKSSTAFLCKHLLSFGGKKVFAASDVGGSLCEALISDEAFDYIILELSTKQIEKLGQLKASYVILTNLTKVKSMKAPDEYVRHKLSVLKNADDSTTVIYNYRDAYLRKYVPPYPGKKRLIRRKSPIANGEEFAQLYRGSYIANRREVVWTNGEHKESFEIKRSPLFGLYHLENLMLAINLAKEVGLNQEQIRAAVSEFPGVPHRLELVRLKGGVKFINDSRSIDPLSLQKALEAFPHDSIILIAGGKNSQDEFSSVGPLVKKRVKSLILLGETKEQMNRDLGDYSETFIVGTFEEAILMSYQKSREGDVVLLSPGCEGYDMFISYEERGNYFRRYLAEV